MKKTIIALMALSGLAMAEELALTLPEASDYTWVSGKNPAAFTSGAIAESIGSFVEQIGADNMTGWFAGTGQGHTTYTDDVEIKSSTSFQMTSRPALSGEYVVLGIQLPDPSYSITMSFESTNKIGFSLWAWDGSSATELDNFTVVAESGAYTTDALAIPETLVESSPYIYAVWQTLPSGQQVAGGSTGITVSNISVKYNAIPEPTTATLSLLALAGLAARRRRR